MNDVYKRLAKHLDALPAGYPATDSGVELRILKRLFIPEEAEASMALSMLPESAGAIAKKLEKNESDIETLLYSMSRKGLILRLGEKQFQYMAVNFMAGIWEFNVNNLDEKLVEDVNEFIPQIWEKTWSKQKTQQHRVIPVSESVSVEMNVMPYEQAESIIKEQTKIVVAPCICRKEQNMAGHGCDKPIETCMMLGDMAVFYEQNGIGRSISKEEAAEIINKGVEAGLVLQPHNSQNPNVICMCCGCCCLVLKHLNGLDAPAQIACTNYYAVVSEDNCTGCGSCEGICQMGAIALDNESAVVNRDRCIGCGLCVKTCEFDGVMLVEKQASEKQAIPVDTIETYMNMARERGLF